MFDDSLDCGWVNDVLCQAVDGDFFNSLQLTVLLLLDFVFRVDYCLVDESGDVGVSVWGEWWCVQAVGCGGFVDVDRLNFLLVNDEGDASMATSPLLLFSLRLQVLHIATRGDLFLCWCVGRQFG